MIRIAICDNSAVDREQLHIHIKSYMEELCTPYRIDIFDKSETLAYKIDEGKEYDICFLDIEMPQIDGMQLSEKICKINPNTLVTLVTEHDELVYDSFRVSPYRFIPKNMLTERLEEAVKSAVKKTLERPLGTIMVNNSNEMDRIVISEIISIKRDGKNIVIKWKNNREIKTRMTMRAIWQQISEQVGKGRNEDLFVWLNSGSICNVDQIVKIKDECALMTNNESIKISRDKLNEVKASIKRRALEGI